MVAGQAAYAFATKLQKDYEDALTDFQAQTKVEEERKAGSVRRHAEASAAASLLAAKTTVKAEDNATLTFLRENSQRLLNQVAVSEDADLIAQCTRLKEQVAAFAGTGFSSLLEEYINLSKAVSATRARKTASTRSSSGYDIVADELALLQQEIASPLFAGPEAVAVRAQLLRQLETLKRLPQNESAVVRQGLELLRGRVHREVRAQSERAQKQFQDAKQLREMVNEMLAKLYAVSRQATLPGSSQKAAALLERLVHQLANSEHSGVAAFESLAVQVAATFADCEKSLQDQAMAEYVGAEVTDVLLSLGYRVAQVGEGDGAGQGTCTAALDSTVGVQFRLNAQGRLGTEMVAFNEQAADVDAVAQERVCALVDKVLGALQRRRLTVRQKVRRSFPQGHRLRVVQALVQQEQGPANAAQQALRRRQP